MLWCRSDEHILVLWANTFLHGKLVNFQRNKSSQNGSCRTVLEITEFCAEIGTTPPIVHLRVVSVRQVFCSYGIEDQLFLCRFPVPAEDPFFLVFQNVGQICSVAKLLPDSNM